MPKIERIKKRHLQKVREQKDLLEQIGRDMSASIEMPDGRRLEEGELEDGTRVLLSEGTILFFQSSGRMLPTLRVLLDGTLQIPEVAVDMGATWEAYCCRALDDEHDRDAQCVLWQGHRQ